jgi:hypothetical protein
MAPIHAKQIAFLVEHLPDTTIPHLRAQLCKQLKRTPTLRTEAIFFERGVWPWTKKRIVDVIEIISLPWVTVYKALCASGCRRLANECASL